jgi:hypothetical protein
MLRAVRWTLLLVLAATPAVARPPESRDMRLVGQHDLQRRPAYQPVVVRQGGRFIAYVGHHAGSAPDPRSGRPEPNGTSIVDVSDPGAPRYLHHLPGAPGEGGAMMVRVCSGDELPRAARGRTYLLRTLGRRAHELWDVSDPSRPTKVTTVVAGLGETHKNWWECATGVAYLVSDGRPQGWRTDRMTKIFDLGDPARPRFIRDFGLPGHAPGSTGGAPPGVHGPIAHGDRVYFAYGTGSHGILQIVDRRRLLEGDATAADRFAPTRDNLAHPELGRLVMNPDWGGHTSFPVHGIPVAAHAASPGHTRDVVVLVSESIREGCREVRQLTFLVDVTDPARPQSVATFDVPPGDFCTRGGRFGPHASNESFTPVYYGRLVFLAYFNAGVRAVDIRNPFQPREVAFFVPASTSGRPVQTNNVEVDDRGYIYIVDRGGGGLHVLELTGAARAIAALP